MHYLPCQFCKKENVVELYSHQFLTPKRRFGWDYYHCRHCLRNFVIAAGETEYGFAILTNEPYDKFVARAMILAFDRIRNDSKYSEKEGD